MTDVWLPGISGIELTRKLNKDQRYCNIPIVIMSSSSYVRTINAEKIKKSISIEYERALRGKQPFSFMKLKVEPKDTKACANEISKKIRKIDMVYVVEESIIVILPLTDKKGLDVVLDKIDNQILQCNIKILEKKFITFTADSPKSIDDLLEIIL